MYGLYRCNLAVQFKKDKNFELSECHGRGKATGYLRRCPHFSTAQGITERGQPGRNPLETDAARPVGGSQDQPADVVEEQGRARGRLNPRSESGLRPPGRAAHALRNRSRQRGRSSVARDSSCLVRPDSALFLWRLLHLCAIFTAGRVLRLVGVLFPASNAVSISAAEPDHRQCGTDSRSAGWSHSATVAPAEGIDGKLDEHLR